VREIVGVFVEQQYCSPEYELLNRVKEIVGVFGEQ